MPRAEGSTVNDDTIIVIDFLGSIKAENLAKDLFNPKTGRIEIIYALTSEREEKNEWRSF